MTELAESNTLAALVQRHLLSMQTRGYALGTVEGREEHLKRFLSFADARGLSRPNDVTKPILERYQRHLFHARKADGRPLSKGRQAQLLMGVLGFFKWLRKERLIAFDPGAEIELPRAPRSLPAQLLSVDEVERVLNAIAPETLLDIRDRAMLETLYSTGVRVSELAHLLVEHFELERGLVTVRKGKGGADRVVPVGERAVRWVDKYLVDVRPALLTRGPETSALFLSLRGQAFRPQSLSLVCRRRILAAGIDKPGSAHVFRHAAATGMLDGGADIRFIQAMLGHQRLASTQIYTRVAIQKLKDVHTKTHPAKLKRTRPTTSDGES